MDFGRMLLIGLMAVTAVISTIFALFELPVVISDRKK
jgi:hypothetical protein